MGSMLSSAFIPPETLLGCTELGCDAPFSSADWAWGLVQALTLMALYGFVLFQASNLLSEGSELLLLVPQLAGLVGSVVLPILGAVPDGAIMLFSGLGPGAQDNLSVGVGALAGSTIMLLTVPWGICTLLGSVPLNPKTGEPNYHAKRKTNLSMATLGQHGCTPSASIRANANVMVLTALGFLVIQVPAWGFATTPSSPKIIGELAGDEHYWSLGALVFAVASFVAYLLLMVKQSGQSAEHQDKVNQAITKAVTEGHVSLLQLFGPIMDYATQTRSGRGLGQELMNVDKQQLTALVKPLFKKYDVNGDGHISMPELCCLLKDMNEDVAMVKSESGWLARLDPGDTGKIGLESFTDAILFYSMEKVSRPSFVGTHPVAAVEEAMGDDDAGSEDDDESVPEDIKHLSWQEQQKVIKTRSMKMMLTGTAMVLIFSDPMVGVMSNVGARIGVAPFYVSFILAPLASNASELIASISYAKKQNKKTISVALAALEGAACMNNTFCLAIFMGLLYFQGLAWKFTAETVSILLIELVVAFVASQRIQTARTGALVLCLFPLSIVFIAALEGMGID